MVLVEDRQSYKVQLPTWFKLQSAQSVTHEMLEALPYKFTIPLKCVLTKSQPPKLHMIVKNFAGLIVHVAKQHKVGEILGEMPNFSYFRSKLGAKDAIGTKRNHFCI